MADDDDLAEMRRMRQTRTYGEFDQGHGSRKKAKHVDDDDEGPTVVSMPESAGSSRNVDEDDMMANMLPTGFGKVVKENKNASGAGGAGDNFDAEAFAAMRKKKVKPAEPEVKAPGPSKQLEKVYVFGVNNPPQMNDDDDDYGPTPVKAEEQEVEYEEVEPENPYKIPYAHEVELKGHTKAVSALALDPAGARLITGSYDYQLKMWDFPAMDRSFRSFRTFEPTGNYLMHTLSYSLSGDRFLVASQSPQAKVFDRDGKEILEFAKGYQYLADMAQTKGHISNITTAMWHPLDPSLVLTAGQDSTIRIWSVDNIKQQKTLIKVKNEKNLNKNPVSAITMDEAGKYLVVACQDSSIQLYPGKGPFLKATTRLPNAHMLGAEVSSLCVSKDGYTLLSRAMDDTMKVWDLRKFTAPVRSFTGLPNNYKETKCVFSPDEALIVTGTSVTKNSDATGNLVFFDKTSLEMVKQVSVSQASVLSVLWHPKINQIVAGCSDGVTHVMFDPAFSSKGALYSVSKAPRVTKKDFTPDRPIITPNALPMFKDAPSLKKQREKARKDPVRSRKPEAPQIGPGSKGRAGSNTTADMMKNLVHKDIKEQFADPREAILKYANEAKENPIWFKVYEQNPTVLDYQGLAEAQKQEEEKAAKAAQQQQHSQR